MVGLPSPRVTSCVRPAVALDGFGPGTSMTTRQTVLLVAAGGMIGTALRIGLAVALDGVGLPVATAVVNLAGSAFLGYLLGRSVDPAVRALLGVGLAGSVTTFSTLMAESISLGAWGVVYLVLSVLLGVALVRAGWAIGRARRP